MSKTMKLFIVMLVSMLVGLVLFLHALYFSKNILLVALGAAICCISLGIFIGFSWAVDRVVEEFGGGFTEEKEKSLFNRLLD